MLKEVSREEYAKAIVAAIHLAMQPTSGGRVAAQALLSAYNGDKFQLDVASLGDLDWKNYETVLTVIRGRYETRHEPHTLVKDGCKIFHVLWNRWQRLSVEERGKRTCPTCDGIGRVYRDDNDKKGQECSRCSGKGRVCGCQL
jgi:hypothetical protein